MIAARVTKLVKDRGFGFAQDDFKQLYFFHYSAIDPKSGFKIDDMSVGDNVSFEEEKTDKGPRAKPRSLKLVPKE